MYERKRMVAGPGFSFISLIFTFSIQSFLSISLVLYDFRNSVACISTFFQQTLNYPVPWPATDRDPSQVPAWSVIPFSPDLLQPVQPIQPSWHTLDSLSITTLFQPLPWEVTWELQIYKFSNSVHFFFPEILHTFHKWQLYKNSCKILHRKTVYTIFLT